MKIETTPRDDHQVEVVAELDQESMEKYKRQAARKISQESKIPGFRPGKAPYAVVLRMYGDEAIQKQALDIMVDDIYPQMLDEAGIKPGGPGELGNILSLDPVKLSFIVPLEPVVELCDYKSMQREYIIEPVSDEDVERVIRNLQVSFGAAEPVERPIEEKDMVYIRLKAHLTQPAEGEDADVIRETSLQVAVNNKDIDEDKFPFVNFSLTLVGMSEKEEKTFTYTYPEDSDFEKLRGREVEFWVKIISVKTVALPELDDEFAKTLGSYETIAELRTTVRENLETRRKREYEDGYLLALIDEISEQSIIKFPPQMLAEEVDHILEAFKEDLAKEHRDMDTYLKSVNKSLEALIEEEVKPAARQRISRSLVIEELARAEDIQISREELVHEVGHALEEMRESPEFEKEVRKANNAELLNSVTMRTATRMLNERVLGRLLKIAKGEAEEETPAQPEEPPAVEEEKAE